MQLCGVCCEHTSKYKCPVCRIRYCSLGCFKKHKSDDSCQPVQTTELPTDKQIPGSSQRAAEETWAVDDLLDEDSRSDRVSLDKLQQLGESEALISLLRNPHLRNLMMTVDSAEDKAGAMKKAMQEPLFVELANQCLQIIEPSERNDDDE
ncbi:zinc finger HIT domain-containing protein 3 [Trichomycterus rosablanca]|uniref:zinc finger HIT domain-containing protein 3 n=1 Tax=Trichomycterus rosablanca TaxID=2290929 RepID=UPI002F3566ED